MDYNALEHMTVLNLREEAKKHDIKGVTGMKKDELIHAIAEKLGLEAPVKRPKKAKKTSTQLDKGAIKKKIVELKGLHDAARSKEDRKGANLLRKRIHSLKRRMRRIA